ncbi:NAD+ diphosphatase [Pacificibacter maritimus]|uniref:NAD(+) diphosphatase n=1 Tax=Pacificibacter maritimus TaxID=762213 RepID=A0A3N4U6X5_9RHOB|nr:NAD(+) diphosphatase [Pacificibacter maritimus]RPE66496.1 NAD+ diphosphatase [Pacificibacter maritimus]
MTLNSVAFAAGLLARRDDLRGTSEDLKTRSDALFVPIWKLKPLIHDTGDLAFLPVDHAFLSQDFPTIFMGLNDQGMPVFACDVSIVEMDEDEHEGSGFLDLIVQRHREIPNAGFADLRQVMSQLSPKDAEIASTARAVLGWHLSHGFCSTCGAASQISLGGWKRECPSCSAQHFPRTDPCVIMLVTRGNSVLLGRSAHFPEGMYSLLAGFVEPGEPIEGAVRREVMEEAGVQVGDVSYVTSQPWPFPGSLMIGCAAQALSQDIVIDENELQDALWLSKEDCVAMVAGEHPNMRAPKEGTIAQFLITKWLADC